jgi:hypothetical protein
MTEENCRQRAVIANGLACPHCGRPIRPYDFERIGESAIQINCQRGHKTLIKLEG